MFEFLFEFPLSVFSKGTFVLLGAWPRWFLLLMIGTAAAALGWVLWVKRPKIAASLRGMRLAVLWGLQSAMIALLLLLL